MVIPTQRGMLLRRGPKAAPMMSRTLTKPALIEEVVRLSDHNKTLAAKHLGLTRFALDRRLKKQIDHE